MSLIKLGFDGDSSSVYELISILDIHGSDGGLIYELHNPTTIGKEEPNQEFINRSKNYYPTFVNPSLVDLWASHDIGYAAKINDIWYLASDVGSNTYLGTGPTSVLKLREFCFKKQIKILYIENSAEEWINNLLNNNIQNKIRHDETRTESQSYNEANLIITRCGEGISRIIKTAAKLSETECRDLFLAAANSHTGYVVEAEPINRVGFIDLKLTDIKLLISFLYEFKIHSTSKDIKRGLNQITEQYLTGNNRHNGLVFINVEKKDVSHILQKITKELDLLRTRLKIIDIKTEYDNHRIVVTHGHIKNEKLICILTIFIIDIQL